MRPFSPSSWQKSRSDLWRNITWQYVGSWGKLRAVDPATDMYNQRDEQFSYGLTVSIAVQQCMAGDQFYLEGDYPSELGSNFTRNITGDYWEPNCAYFYRGTGNVGIYKDIISRTWFFTPNLKRLQLLFAWILWVDQRIQNYTMDPETRHVYMFFISDIGVVNWDQGFGLCRAISDEWMTPSIGSPAEKRIVDGFMKNNPVKTTDSPSRGPRLRRLIHLGHRRATRVL